MEPIHIRHVGARKSFCGVIVAEPAANHPDLWDGPAGWSGWGDRLCPVCKERATKRYEEISK